MPASIKKNLNPLLLIFNLKDNFIANVAANTRAFVLVISDKIFSFQSDGNKMSEVY